MGYFMNRKIIRYLESKLETEYTVLDEILKMCIDGELYRLLRNKGFIDIRIYPEIHKKRGNIVYVYFTKTDDFRVMSNFTEKEYEYAIYSSHDEVEDVDKNFKRCKYEKTVNVKDIFDIIIQDLITQYNQKY